MRTVGGSLGATLALLVAAAAPVRADVDVFGLIRMRPSRQPPQEWTSAHWAQGAKRTLSPGDPLDTTGWSRIRGQTTLMEVDGAGTLRMGGPQARLYFQSSARRKVFFRDVEFTGYFRRVGGDGAVNGGFNVGVRSSENGHGDVDHCYAHTYYLGFRYPGTWVFYKELDHPNGQTGASGRLIAGGGGLPAGKWIGMKYLSYNVPGRANAVKLEAWIDTVSDGDPSQGGEWKKVAEIVDDGSWTAPTGTCGYPGNTVVTEGGGVVFIRNTEAAEAQYKMISIREIVPEGPTALAPPGNGRAGRAGTLATPGTGASAPPEGFRWLGPAWGGHGASYDAAGRRVPLRAGPLAAE